MIGHSIAFVIGQNCIVAFRLSFALGELHLGLTSIRLLMLPRFRLFPSYRFLYGLFGFAFWSSLELNSRRGEDDFLHHLWLGLHLFSPVTFAYSGFIFFHCNLLTPVTFAYSGFIFFHCNLLLMSVLFLLLGFPLKILTNNCDFAFVRFHQKFTISCNLLI